MSKSKKPLTSLCIHMKTWHSQFIIKIISLVRDYSVSMQLSAQIVVFWVNTKYSGRLLPLFQKNLLPPFSGQKPEMEKVHTSNILVPTYQTIQCHNRTDNYLYFPCHEGHKSHVVD